MNISKNSAISNHGEQYTQIQLKGCLIIYPCTLSYIDLQNYYENSQSYLNYRKQMNKFILENPELSEWLYFDENI